MKKEIITALPVICKLSGRTKDLIVEENGRPINNSVQNILERSPFVQLEFVTEVSPKDENLVRRFEKLNKKYTACCPVEDFIYPYIEAYSKSFHDVIPFDTQTKNIMEAYHEIKRILDDYNAEYVNGMKKAKLKYKILMRVPETYKSGEIESL